MANWCANSVEFFGGKSQLKQVMKMFKAMSRKGKREMLGQLPDFIDKKQPHFFDMAVVDNTLVYNSKWEPNNQVLREIANHFNLRFVNNYDELNNGLFGRAIFDGERMLDVSLDTADLFSYDADIENQSYLFEGTTYKYVMPILELILDRKVAEANDIFQLAHVDIKEPAADRTGNTGKLIVHSTTTPENGKDAGFVGNDNITAEDLRILYGDLLKGDLLLKFAEHGNLKAAKAVFDTFEEEIVIATKDFLEIVFQNLDKLAFSAGEVSAMRFLDSLINDRDAARTESHRVKIEQVQSGTHGELLAIRLKGKLPHIDIAGTDFTIDWRLRQLRETESPWNGICLENLERTKPDGGFAFLYHTEDHTVYEPEDRVFSLPQNIVLIEIPNERVLDPIAVARELDFDHLNFLIDNPICADLKAIVKPLSESILPDLIELSLNSWGDYPGDGFDEDWKNERKPGR